MNPSPHDKVPPRGPERPLHVPAAGDPRPQPHVGLNRQGLSDMNPPPNDKVPPRGPERSLDFLFAPKTVAVIGATDRKGSVGRAVLENLGGFKGSVYPVNPKHASLLGAPSFPSVAAVPAKIDLAVIATPAPTVPGNVRECAQAGVKGAIILSAGFKECGPEGAALERRIREEAGPCAMRIIGPNCLGVMVPPTGFNARS